jgi:hypothetical protein
MKWTHNETIFCCWLSLGMNSKQPVGSQHVEGFQKTTIKKCVWNLTNSDQVRVCDSFSSLWPSSKPLFSSYLPESDDYKSGTQKHIFAQILLNKWYEISDWANKSNNERSFLKNSFVVTWMFDRVVCSKQMENKMQKLFRMLNTVHREHKNDIRSLK